MLSLGRVALLLSSTAISIIGFRPTVHARRSVFRSLATIVVGDGDLSHSAALARKQTSSTPALIGTVLEPMRLHRETYAGSQSNARIITEAPNSSVQYGVDVYSSCCLGPPSSVPPADNIIFNFPHIPGKANVKYNRLLISAFFKNTRQYLAPNGTLSLALLSSQMGCNARDKVEWKASWNVQSLAMEEGFYLSRVTPFKLDYNLSSYRGRDMDFRVTDSPSVYQFKKIDDVDDIVKKLHPDNYRMCYYHELHLRLDENDPAPSITEVHALVRSAIELSNPAAPLPIDAEVRFVADLREHLAHAPIDAVVIFEIAYKSRFLRRHSANDIRHALEVDVIRKNNLFDLYEKKKGLFVSNVIPESMNDLRSVALMRRPKNNKNKTEHEQ